MIDTSLDIALEFLRAHPQWFIFPIRRLEKDPPLIKDNLVAASNDPKQIKQWHDKWRGCNWGLALRKSKVIVVDVDRKPGKNGQQTLDNLVLEYGELPETLTVMSPSGGLHIYFEGEHRFGLGKYGFGPDVDSPNYVLIPGCWICSNFERGYEIIDESPVAQAPDWFGLFLKEKAEREAPDAEAAVDLDKDPNVARMIRYLQEGAPKCVQGQGGEKTLFDIFCVLKDNGVSLQRAIDIVARYYNVPGKCEPLWLVGSGPDSDRLDIKGTNAYQYARENKAGSATAEFVFGGSDAVTEQDIKDTEKLAKHWEDKIMPAWRARDEERIQEKNEGRASGETDEDEPGYMPGEDAEAEAQPEARPDPPPEAPPPVDDGDFLAAGDVTVNDADFTSEDDPQPDPPPDPPPKGGKKDKAESDDDEAEADQDDTGAEAQKEAPVTGRTYDDVCAEWVWIVALERFVRVKDSKMWSRSQFDSRFNHFVDTASVSANIFKTKGKIRRFDGSCFRPGKKMILNPDFNLWRQSKVVPKQGNTDLWNEHLNYLFQNPEDKDHVLNWLSWVYQNQSRKPNHALLIVGKNTGTGKSFIARVFEQLIGVENTQRPKNSSLKGDFNGWALRCKLCIIEELMQIGRREVANELRDIITEPTIEVNIKNVPAQLVENYMGMMGISNHPDALPIDDTDRRWLVVSTPVSRLDPDYYRRLFEILDGPKSAEMLAAIAYELKTRSLAMKNADGEPLLSKEGNPIFYDASQAAPDTDAKREMITLSRSDVETWLNENLQNQPLCRNIITTQDIIETMPSTLQRTTRLNVVIVSFLRDKARGEVLGMFRTNDGRRQRLWGLHGKSPTLRLQGEQMIVNLYETGRKQKAGADESALSDDDEQVAQDFQDAD